MNRGEGATDTGDQGESPTTAVEERVVSTAKEDIVAF